MFCRRLQTSIKKMEMLCVTSVSSKKTRAPEDSLSSRCTLTTLTFFTK